MAIPNTHPETGIAYGAIAGSTVPDLLDEIARNGRDLTFEESKLELQKHLKSVLTEALHDWTPRASRILSHVLDDFVDDLLDAGLAEDLVSDEAEYYHTLETEHGLVELRLLWLQGPLVMVLESPWVLRCRPCSPCVPRAGDLDSPDPEGMTAYCVPPEWLPEDWEGPQPELLAASATSASA